VGIAVIKKLRNEDFLSFLATNWDTCLYKIHLSGNDDLLHSKSLPLPTLCTSNNTDIHRQLIVSAVVVYTISSRTSTRLKSY